MSHREFGLASIHGFQGGEGDQDGIDSSIIPGNNVGITGGGSPPRVLPNDDTGIGDAGLNGDLHRLANLQLQLLEHTGREKRR